MNKYTILHLLTETFQKKQSRKPNEISQCENCTPNTNPDDQKKSKDIKYKKRILEDDLMIVLLSQF